MKSFNQRWQECAAKARQSEAADRSAPFGFAPRVMSELRASRPVLPSVLLFRLAMRALIGATAFLILLAAWEYPAFQSNRLPLPHIETAVTQMFWLL